MSRIGKQPITVPAGVKVNVQGRDVLVEGSQGKLSFTLPEPISASAGEGTVEVVRCDDTRHSKSYHGLSRSLIANMIEGVSTGFKKELEIEGVGFRAAVQGRKVMLWLGFASPKEFSIPEGVNVAEEGGTKLVVSGADKQAVGEAAARIRAFFPAEPYKGKGIKYKGERIRRKVGKTVA
jgi:large subunit ribosomal protein L6